MDGRYKGVNRSFEKFFGKKKEKLVGKTVFDVNPPHLAEIYQAKDNELLKAGGEQRYESQVKNANGELRDVIFNKSVYTDSKGSIVGLIGAVIDITDRNKAEQQRESLIVFIRWSVIDDEGA